ncbi:MAG: type II secretion system F family protein [Armatimonadetes bacterium]|nr:type II secretion system F family protein [Armatimonadota bacterium]MDE2207991.1 type II secretion system F family protein [Armatimonadota bacterium]
MAFIGLGHPLSAAMWGWEGPRADYAALFEVVYAMYENGWPLDAALAAGCESAPQYLAARFVPCMEALARGEMLSQAMAGQAGIDPGVLALIEVGDLEGRLGEVMQYIAHEFRTYVERQHTWDYNLIIANLHWIAPSRRLFAFAARPLQETECTREFAMLYRGGVPVARALEVAASRALLPEYGDALRNAAENTRNGCTIAESLTMAGAGGPEARAIAETAGESGEFAELLEGRARVTEGDAKNNGNIIVAIVLVSIMLGLAAGIILPLLGALVATTYMRHHHIFHR